MSSITHTSSVASLDVVVGAREYLLHEQEEARVVGPQLGARVDRVVVAIRRVRVCVRVEVTLHAFALATRTDTINGRASRSVFSNVD